MIVAQCRRPAPRFRLFGFGLALLLAACGKHTDDAVKGANGADATEVGYVVLESTTVPMTQEFPGRTVAYQSSEVRPQVGGVIQKRLFTEGALVKAGQPLYQIDPSLYSAAVKQAEADLESAKASEVAAREQAERYKPLAELEAVSRQDYANAVASASTAKAAIAQRAAALDTARINLRFATVPAPISGRIGRTLFTEGALVSPSQADPLTTINRLDPMYVDIQQSAADLLALRRALAAGRLQNGSAEVTLRLEDGSDYACPGTLQFSEVVVDTTTGTVTLRAKFPNPDGVLLPGLFVRASLSQAVNAQAVLVPQQALTRDPKGNATLWIIDENDRAQLRTVSALRPQGQSWVVTQGVAAGDRVIVQGTGKVRPDTAVRPVVASTPQSLQSPDRSGPVAGARSGT